MKTKFIILISFLIITIAKNAEARLSPGEYAFQLQLQKSLFVSGEKIWFINSLVSNLDNNHQTILYVDLCGEGSIVNSCIIKRENNHWEGSLSIPDSLETGIYLLRAYTGNYDGKAEITTKLVTVINRFGNNKYNESKKQSPGYKPLDLIHYISPNSGKAFTISGESGTFKTNSSINLKIKKNNQNSPSVVSLSVFRVPDDSVSMTESNAESNIIYASNDQTKIFNKLTLSGRIVSKSLNDTLDKEIVLFSIPDTIPQINYATTNEKGEFLFDVGDYFGTQDVIIQTLNKTKDLTIVIDKNLLDPPVKIPYYIPDEIEKSDFATLSVNRFMMGKAYSKSFEKVALRPSNKFPFFGYTKTIVIPDRYIDLDDFEEITKELLPLCHIHKEKKTISYSIFDPVNMRYSDNPWIIVDGVPLFDIKPILPFNSQRIRKIEVQTETRCFGGLSIEGALSVISKEGNFSNIALPINSTRIEYESFQRPEIYPSSNFQTNSVFPDFRDVLYWKPSLELLKEENVQQIHSSFEKGNYVAVAQAIDANGSLNRSVFQFSVK